MGLKRELERQEAIRLRLQGKSYNEIRRMIGVPSKGTISVWLRGIKLTAPARARLKEKMQRANERGLLRFNTERTTRIRQENTDAFNKGLGAIKAVNRRDILILGIAFYWGEGTKNITTSKFSLSLANSDPALVAGYLRFLREILHVPEEKICGGIHLYDGTTEKAGKEYWANITKIPEHRFYVVRQISKSSKGRRNPRLLPYGTVVIRVHDRKFYFEMMGMIKGLEQISHVEKQK